MINVVAPDPNIFLWIAVSLADAAAVNPNGIKTLLAYSLNYFPIKGNSVLVMVLRILIRILPKNPPDCTILGYWVFESFILADEPFAKALRIFEICVLVNNNLWGKLFSSLESPTTLNERFNNFGSIFYGRWIRQFYI